MEVVAEARWSWMLLRDGESLYLSVLCGSVGLYTRDLALTPVEAAAYRSEGLVAVTRLARCVMDDPGAYQGRHLPGFATDPATTEACQRWRAVAS